MLEEVAVVLAVTVQIDLDLLLLLGGTELTEPNKLVVEEVEVPLMVEERHMKME